MTSKQQYADITQAWAEGADIEVSITDTIYSSSVGVLPQYNENFYYRIKPEVEVYYGMLAMNTAEQKPKIFTPTTWRSHCDNIKMTFHDGELVKFESI
jgi:hypothetical protein